MLVTVPQGVAIFTFPNALGHLIPTLVLEQRLGRYEGNFLDRGQGVLIEDKHGYVQANRLCRDRLVGQPGEGVSRVVGRAGLYSTLKSNSARRIRHRAKTALSFRQVHYPSEGVMVRSNCEAVPFQIGP
jgi:hypothetical protein